MTRTITRTMTAIALSLAAGTAAHAQDDDWINGSASITESSASASTQEIVWSDAEIEKLGTMLAGSWRSSGGVSDIDGGNPSAIVMNIAPVAIDGMPDALYVESSRQGEGYAPFRHAFFQLYRSRGEIRVRTLDVAMNDGSHASILTGMWAAPEFFPEVSRDDLIATLDIVLKPTADGFSGRTPYPYPTAIGGAVEMTSEMTITPTRLVATDKGMGPDGSIVWGGAGATTFDKVESPVVRQNMGGVTTLDFANPGEVVVADRDTLHVNYWGYLTDGTRFDTSKKPGGRPLIFPYPAGQRFIAGFGAGMEGLSVGTWRRVIIPGDLGYGPNGNPRAGIPGNATLIFDLEVLHIDKASESGVADPHAGHDHSGHDHNHDHGDHDHDHDHDHGADE